jgi:hypothetical protein
MKKYIILFCVLWLKTVSAQSDTLGRALYTRIKTYQNGMANLWKQEGLVMDSIWVCCDTIINQKPYVKYGDKAQGRGYYVAELDSNIWVFDKEKQKEYLFIPKNARIGYNVDIYHFSITILNNKATFRIYDVVFDELIELEFIGGNQRFIHYFKRGVGMIAELREGQIIHILERNIFANPAKKK